MYNNQSINNIIGGGRIQAIDIARGIAMLLVIIQHNGAFNQFILSFHMPLFFMISGLVVNNSAPKTTFSQEIKNNTIRLLLPQLMLGLFEILFIEVFGFYETHSFHTLSFNEVFNAIFRWWFLLVMFQIRLLIWLFRKYMIYSKWKQCVFILSLVFLAACVQIREGHFYGMIGYPFLVPISTLFVLIGYYAKKKLLKSSNVMSGLFIVLAMLFTIILAETNSMVFMYKADFGCIFLFMITAIVGSFCIIRFSNSFNSHFLAWVGEMSLPIYVLQFHINQYSRAIEALLLDAIGCENVNIKIALTVLLSLSLCCFITYCISKNKITSVLFGLK